MRWQRIAQGAIAVFVIGFIVVLGTSLRRVAPDQPAPSVPERTAPDAALENPGGGLQEATDPSGRQQWSIRFGRHVARADGSSELSGGVEATINRGDRRYVVKSNDAEVVPAADGVDRAVFRNDVVVTGDGGLEIKANEATYTQAEGVVTLPGPVTFTKGRTRGSGVGATYDQGREVFWLKEQARVDVAAGERGEAPLEASADAIGLARHEHYLRLEGNARIVGQDRTADADGIVVRLTDDEQRVQALELRGNSRISGSGAVPAMSARDIDLTYGADGRTLQQARLLHNAVVGLPGAGGGGRRIAGNTIDIGMGADGSTVTSLEARQQVQVDLPADGETPSRTIRAAALSASGGDGGGLQQATFTGGVDYRENRPARKNQPAFERAARSQTLIVATKPGLGAIERADFRGSVRFVDPPDVVAEAQQGLYDVPRGRLELAPLPGQPGPVSPTVTDGNVTVAARTIQFSLSTGAMTAETTVRSTIQPQKRDGRTAPAAKMPSVLAEDQPVNVTSNRLAYQGAGASAVYSGNVTLWQGDTTIKADTVSIDDSSGNLTAKGKVVTTFPFEEKSPRGAPPAREITTGTAETFVYEEAKRLATYTESAHIKGPQGDVTGARIELYLEEDGNELQRAEAYGENGAVQVQEGNRIAKGSHLTYTAANSRYLLVGSPVEIVEEKKGTCTLTVGATATFNRATESARVDGSTGGNIPMRSETLKACPAELLR